MDLSNPVYVDAVWLILAFASGLVAKRFGLPPLVGFLLTGFVINLLGLNEGKVSDVLQAIADLGVMLLLFTIGLKIKLKALFKPEIWVTAGVHMIITVLAIGSLVFLLSYTGLQLFTDLSFETSMLIGFALSFSSTVFVVKILQERGELESYHGKLAIGILIMQDIVAVTFIAFSSKTIPSIWVLALPAILYAIRWVLGKVLNVLDHGEMLTVFGFFATLIAGAMVFSLLELKPDLGALVIGMLLVDHPRADELYDRMMNYKDFFLIAFFINIGLTGMPTFDVWVAAAILLPLILLKGLLFLLVLSRFDLRARTAFLASLSLGNYSEFGLIVGFVGLEIGILPSEWLVAIAILMTVSFLISSPLNTKAHVIFDRYKSFITKLNRSTKTIDTQPDFLGDAQYVVIGMGSIGLPAYKTLNNKFPNKVIGLDYKHELVKKLQEERVNAVWADTTDSQFWENVDLTKVKMIFLTMSDYASNRNTLDEINMLKHKPFKISAVCHYADHAHKYRELNVAYPYEYKSSLGHDFVENALAAV